MHTHAHTHYPATAAAEQHRIIVAFQMWSKSSSSIHHAQKNTPAIHMLSTHPTFRPSQGNTYVHVQTNLKLPLPPLSSFLPPLYPSDLRKGMQREWHLGTSQHTVVSLLVRHCLNLGQLLTTRKGKSKWRAQAQNKPLPSLRCCTTDGQRRHCSTDSRERTKFAVAFTHAHMHTHMRVHTHTDTCTYTHTQITQHSTTVANFSVLRSQQCLFIDSHICALCHDYRHHRASPQR